MHGHIFSISRLYLIIHKEHCRETYPFFSELFESARADRGHRSDYAAEYLRGFPYPRRVRLVRKGPIYKNVLAIATVDSEPTPYCNETGDY